MNKPLTKLEREEIVARIARGEYNSHEASHHAEADILLLISAEAFWREIVKNRPRDIEFDGRSGGCYFDCGGPPHAADCPWLLSQESA